MKLWEAQEVADEHARTCLICNPTPPEWMPETPIEWPTEVETPSRWQRLISRMREAIECR